MNTILFIQTELTQNVLVVYLVKPETLASGNFDKFGKLRLNRQTLTFQSKATKQNKRLPTKKCYNAKQNKRLCQHFAKVSFTKIP